MTSALLILNGKKAGIPEIREAVKQLRGEGHDILVRVTWEDGDCLRYVNEATELGVQRVIGGGGDGTVNEAANALMSVTEGQRPAVGILPLGTANDFATACEIPESPLVAMKQALETEPHSIDVIQANDRYFVNVACAGFGAAITKETPVELKNFLGGGAYTLMGVLKALNFTHYPTKLVAPNLELEGEIAVGAVCNGRQAGGGQVLAPEAYIDDGLMDVVVVFSFPILKIDQVFSELSNPTKSGEFIKYFQTPWLEAGGKESMPVNLDGEPYSNPQVRLEVIPNALRLAVPPTCPCIKN
jgi:lipid kinase YegS